MNALKKLIPEQCVFCQAIVSLPPSPVGDGVVKNNLIWLITTRKLIFPCCQTCYQNGSWRNGNNDFDCVNCGKPEDPKYAAEVVFAKQSFSACRLHCSIDCYKVSKRQEKATPQTEAEMLKVGNMCLGCGVTDQLQVCGRCKVVYYCSRACQKADYARHKSFCHSTVACDGNAIVKDLMSA